MEVEIAEGQVTTRGRHEAAAQMVWMAEKAQRNL